MSEELNDRLERKLRSIIETIDVANTLTEPVTDSIENLLRISALELNSEEASVIIRDGDHGDLKFLAAIGQVADQLLNLKIPAGKGIAGFVFSSGQTIALNDVGEDDSFYAEVDKQTGYSTQTILATPLRYKGEIIGVLEYVNRIGGEPFTPAEMDRAALFAEAVSSMVNVYETTNLFLGLSGRMISAEDELKFEEVREWIGNLRETAEYKEMIDLAVLVREIAGHGETDRKLCIDIFESILRWSKSKAETNFLTF